MSGDPVPGPGHAVPLPDSSAILATDGDKTTWLIWGNKRSEIDLNNAAVTAAVGIDVDTPSPRSINRGLLNLIPESPPLVVPFIANAGDPPRFPWPVPGEQAPLVGSVVVDRDESNQLRYYVVTAEGIQPISPVVAAILRANDAYGLVEPPALTPDQIAKAPKAEPVPVEDYPSNPLQVLDPTTDPVSCGQWVKLDGAPTSSLTLLAGQSLPVAADAKPVSSPAPDPPPPSGHCCRRAPVTSCRSPGNSQHRPPRSRCSGSPTSACATAWKPPRPQALAADRPKRSA